MEFTETAIPGCYVIGLNPFQDERGEFVRSYCKNEFAAIGHDQEFVQINYSLTYQKGTTRGMHFQYPPDTEVKLIRCMQGKVFDVILDLRENSPAFLQWVSVELSPENHNMIYIPEGCAHGFQALENNSGLLYHHTRFYTPGNEGGVRIDDQKLNIKWPLPVSNVSPRDKGYPLIDKHFKGINIP